MAIEIGTLRPGDETVLERVTDGDTEEEVSVFTSVSGCASC